MLHHSPSKIEEAEWRKGLSARLKDKEVLAAFYDEASDEIAEERKAKYVSYHVRKMVDDGYKGVYTGEEIISAVKDRKSKVFDDTVDIIVSKMLTSVFRKLGEDNENKALQFDDFLFLALSRNDAKVRDAAFKYMLNSPEAEQPTRVGFIGKSFSSSLNEISISVEASGLDMISELFFTTFRNPSEARESVAIPSPENIIKISI
ncbi:MAG: hypothetical protein IE916_00655 [Epsilonproteobacteria bacterium]|nr:hypothetical protein [Campylobacterota bacterium]